MKSTINCNWKVAAENFAGDAIHAGWTHESGSQVMLGSTMGEFSESYHVNINGHCFQGTPEHPWAQVSTFGDRTAAKWIRSKLPDFEARLGLLRSKFVGGVAAATVFPHMSFLCGNNAFRVWHPRGPHQIDLWCWTLVNRNAPDEIKEAYRVGNMMTFSPTGVFEMDDGENWEHVTNSNRGAVTRRQPMYYGLGLDSLIRHPELPGNVHQSFFNDANQRAFYSRWVELLSTP